MGSRRGHAAFDATRAYRYALTRVWDDDLPRLCFVLLNPSTADSDRDDPTIRRCVGFARSWGFGSLEVVNLFAFRATSPRDLKRTPEPVGPENDAYLAAAVARATRVVAGWGNHGAHRGRAAQVAGLLPDARCFDLTGAGQPRHPLYVRADAETMSFS